VVNTLSISLGSSDIASGRAAAHTGASGSAAAAGRVQGIVVRASAAAVEQIHAASDIVQSVVPDRVVVSQQLLQDEQPGSRLAATGAAATGAAADAAAADIVAQQVPGCTELAAATAGMSARLTSTYKWPRCLVPNARIVWSGRSCGDGSKIQYTQMRAVDAATGQTLTIRGSPCITRFDTQRVTWSRQRFGRCGESALLHVSRGGSCPCTYPVFDSACDDVHATFASAVHYHV
jgi:hypothetical protein